MLRAWPMALLLCCLPLAPARAEGRPGSPLAPSAEDDALARLFQRIFEITLHDGRTLQVLLYGLPEEDARLRRVLAGHVRSTGERRYRDGSVDVDLELDPRDLAAALQQVCQASPALQQRLAQGSALRLDADRICATGLAFPAALAVALPPATAPSTTTRPSPAAPPGWRHLDPQTRDLTLRAARRQALTNLFNDIRRIPVDANHTVATLLRLAPDRIGAFRDALAEAAAYKIELDPGQVCVAHCDVPAQVALDFLSPAVRAEHFPGDVLSAVGYVAPPTAFPPGDRPRPAWYDRLLTADGRRPPPGPASQPKEFARAAATIDAQFRLAQSVDELPWPEGGTVRERIRGAAHLAPDLALYFSGARIVRVPEEPDGPMITLELPLRRLYHLLSENP